MKYSEIGRRLDEWRDKTIETIRKGVAPFGEAAEKVIGWVDKPEETTDTTVKDSTTIREAREKANQSDWSDLGKVLAISVPLVPVVGGAWGALGTMAASRTAKNAIYTGGSLAAGALGAIDNIWDYTAGGIYSLMGKEDKAKALFEDDKAANFRSNVEKIYGDEGANDIMKGVGNVAERIGATIPYMSASILTTAFAPTAGTSALILKGIGKALAYTGLGLQEAGRSTKEAYNETGELTGKEYAYGAAKGAVKSALEVGTDTLIRDKLSTKITGEKAPEFKQKISDLYNSVADSGKIFGVDISGEAKKTIGTWIKARIPGVLSESIEGGMEAWLEPYLKRATYDKDAENATAGEIVGAAALEGFLAVATGNVEIPDANAKKAVEEALEESAVAVATYPEAVVEKYRAAGIDINADDLMDGVDDTDIKSALKSNRTFATISSAVAAGQMMGTQEAEPYKEYLAEFTPEQKAEMASEMGVANDDQALAVALLEYAKTDKGQIRMQRLEEVKQMAQASLDFGGMPMVFGTSMQNGAYSYDNGLTVVKRDDGIHLYDKTTGMVSKPMTTAELNATLARGRKGVNHG